MDKHAYHKSSYMKEHNLFTIEETAKATGISQARLRIWEERYNWPKPHRIENSNYRAYSKYLVEQLTEVFILVKQGKRISELIIDGCLELPKTHPIGKKMIDRDAFDNIPRPETDKGLVFRNEIVAALINKKFGTVEQLVQECRIVVHPKDRTNSCYAVIEAAIEAYTKIGINVDLLTKLVPKELV